jgi:ATP-binding cassette subfamily B protein
MDTETATPARRRTGILELLRTLLRLARPHRLGGIVLMAGLLLETGYDTAFRYSLKLLIDEAIVPGKWQLLIVMLLALAVGALVTQASAFGCDYVWARVGSRIMATLRLRIFEHLQRLHMGFHARSKIGDVMARFSTDLVSVESGLTAAVPAGIFSIGGILFSLGLLFHLEWRLALITLIGLPLSIVGPRWLGARAVAADYDYKQQEALLASQVQENLLAQPVIKAYDLQPHAMKQFRNRLETLVTATVRSNFLAFLVLRTPNVAVLFLHLLVIGTGAVMVFREIISIGDLVAFHSLFTGMSTAVTSMTWVGPYLIEAAGSMQRINEILDEVPQVTDPEGVAEMPPLSSEIRFDDVGFEYAPEQTALTGVTLTIGKGTQTAFVGASGSGKSTLLAMLMRFYDPNSGQVLFDGLDARSVTLESLHRSMAVVFQESFLFNISVRENIRLGRPEATDAEVEAAARQAEIHDFIVSLPEGYKTPAGERGSRFSGGQRQRIAIARALVRSPSILLLDEATSALDPTTEAAVNETLRSIAAGRPVVTVTHRLESSVSCDRIVVIEDGRAVEQGRHEELLAAGGRYAALWHKQSGFSLNERGDEARVTADRLSQFPVFGAMTGSQLDHLKDMFDTQMRAEDSVVFAQGDTSDKFYVIVRGRVAVLVDQPDGGPRRLAELEVGDCFGEMGLIRDIPRMATVQALTQCVFLTLSRTDFKRVVKESPELRETIAALMAHREGAQGEL